jgi:DNA-binding CsgD family transcriptional regulator
MPEQYRFKAKLAKRCQNGPQDFEMDRAVGRIALAGRLFVIALAPDPSEKIEEEEICRFKLDGLSLVVLEDKDARCQNATKIADEIASKLTARELQIAVLVAQGHATKNIAYKLRISEWTVATYLRRIFAKLGVDSRAAMVYRCAPLIATVVDVAALQQEAGAPPPNQAHRLD